VRRCELSKRASKTPRQIWPAERHRKHRARMDTECPFHHIQPSDHPCGDRGGANPEYRRL